MNKKKEVDFKNEVIQGFFNKFTNKGEDYTYIRWNKNLRIGEVVDYMMFAINKTIKDYPLYK